ncbi:uncharacterized protein LOC143460673 [Clavelina lepadiformis]|uniref:NTR domain-containing protein n=1 Tax=Clavelina lepadiformis TaxID=159417 RepID=A0ABP0FN67_CLALP
MSNLLLVLIAFLSIGATRSVESCKCEYNHPQDILCRAEFVGVVKIEDASLNETSGKSTIKAAKLRILHVYKGRSEGFVENQVLFLHTPPDVTCKGPYWEGNQVLSGNAYQGGLFADNCQFREPLDAFTPKQLYNIRTHLRTRAYTWGCNKCIIKHPFDNSFAFADECRTRNNEFPVSTSACLPVGQKGKCKMVQRASNSKFKIPKDPLTTTRPDNPTTTTVSPTVRLSTPFQGLQRPRDVPHHPKISILPPKEDIRKREPTEKQPITPTTKPSAAPTTNSIILKNNTPKASPEMKKINIKINWLVNLRNLKLRKSS